MNMRIMVFNIIKGYYSIASAMKQLILEPFTYNSF